MVKRTPLNRQRVFSEAVKRRYVKLIEDGQETVLSISRTQKVSRSNVYRWISKYSGYLLPGQNLVVQMDSESSKNKALEARIAELEAALGRKQMESDFDKRYIIELEKAIKEDVKKKGGKRPFNGSGTTKGNTPTK